MELNTKAFEKYAKSLVVEVLSTADHAMIFEEFCKREPQFKDKNIALFLEVFVPAKLALGCIYWNACCEDHRIEDKDLRNLFFREVMNVFQSPQSLSAATRFSESLYASNADTETAPTLAVLVHMFHKLGINTLQKNDDKKETIAPSFQWLVEVGEGLRSMFENSFDEFYYSNDSFQAGVSENLDEEPQ